VIALTAAAVGLGLARWGLQTVVTLESIRSCSRPIKGVVDIMMVLGLLALAGSVRPTSHALAQSRRTFPVSSDRRTLGVST